MIDEKLRGEEETGEAQIRTRILQAKILKEPDEVEMLKQIAMEFLKSANHSNGKKKFLLA